MKRWKKEDNARNDGKYIPFTPGPSVREQSARGNESNLHDSVSRLELTFTSLLRHLKHRVASRMTLNCYIYGNRGRFQSLVGEDVIFWRRLGVSTGVRLIGSSPVVPRAQRLEL